MADKETAVSPQRHRNMQRIKGKDTGIERILRRALWGKGYRYRKNYRELPGSPDIVLTKYKIAIFCDGEFFHGKDWDTLEVQLKKGANGEFWINKIKRNMERDLTNDRLLRYEGWTVIHFWGKDIEKHTEACVEAIEEAILEQRLAAQETGV